MTDPAQIPLFPLENVVLFPDVDVPLHVFEPRYRQMTRDCLARSGCIGTVAVLPEHSGDMRGDPPVFDVGCAGTISRSRQLPDGRYHIVLHGTRRFRIRAEPERPQEQLYREAVVEWLEDPLEGEGGPCDLSELRRRALGGLHELARHMDPERAAQLSTDRIAQLDDAPFVNTLCQLLGFPTREKQNLLETDRVPDRLDVLVHLLDFRLAALSGGAPAGSETVH